MPAPQPQKTLNFLESLDISAKQVIAAYLRPVRFSKGERLLRMGDPGDGCYVIDAGEVRLELVHTETDSEAILGYLGTGSLVGEFSLIDGQPRSASAFAHTEVEARWLSKADFERACSEHPAMGVSMLGTLGRSLTTKLRLQNATLAEHLFSGEADPEIQRMVEGSAAAQKEFVNWPEEKVDGLLQEIAETIAAHAPELAEANVADSGIGVIADKIAKIRFAALEVARTLAGQPAAGALRESPNRVVDIATPMGVILGIIPVTNPVSTIVFKTLVCLKARNALILSCHRDALRVGNRTGELIQAVLARHGAPVALVQWIKSRTDRKKTAMLMAHPQVAFILATGGPSIVEAAYSSGTPAIGVGAGNAPVLVCADADLTATAARVIQGKSFDNGVICGSENNLVVEQPVVVEFGRELEAQGAYVLTPAETQTLTTTIFDSESGTLKREFVGKSAARLAQAAGLRPGAAPPRLLVVPAGVADLDGPYAHEKLAPLLSFFAVANLEEGLAVCRRILQKQGLGHTAIVHTRDEVVARRFGAEMPASRILVNVPGSTGCIGIGTGLTPSFTLGCGTGGGNSTTDNVTYTHLLNIKRLALGVPA